MMLLCSIFHFSYWSLVVCAVPQVRPSFGLTWVRSQLLAIGYSIHNFQIRIHYFAAGIICETVRRPLYFIH